jgi:hypothetical protein
MAIEFANGELVARAWLRSLGLSNVNTTVPQNTASWSEDGFVQIAVVGSSTHRETRLRGTVITATCWAVNPTLKDLLADNTQSGKPPGGKAADLAEKIVDGTFDFRAADLDLGVTGAPQARVIGCWLVSDPRRVPGDTAQYARYTVDIEIKWIQL